MDDDSAPHVPTSGIPALTEILVALTRNFLQRIARNDRRKKHGPLSEEDWDADTDHPLRGVLRWLVPHTGMSEAELLEASKANFAGYFTIVDRCKKCDVDGTTTRLWRKLQDEFADVMGRIFPKSSAAEKRERLMAKAEERTKRLNSLGFHRGNPEFDNWETEVYPTSVTVDGVLEFIDKLLAELSDEVSSEFAQRLAAELTHGKDSLAPVQFVDDSWAMITLLHAKGLVTELPKRPPRKKLKSWTGVQSELRRLRGVLAAAGQVHHDEGATKRVSRLNEEAESGSKIFISYRRKLDRTTAHRIYDHLKARFGRDSLFMDVETIPVGADFRQRLSDAVAQCSVLLAVIGNRWVTVRHKRTRRLEDPDDFVRIEIEAALARTIPVIPVLLDQVPMPKSKDLPSPLQELANRHAARVDTGVDFDTHMNRLIRELDLILGRSKFFGESVTTQIEPSKETREIARRGLAVGGEAMLDVVKRRLLELAEECPVSTMLRDEADRWRDEVAAALKVMLGDACALAFKAECNFSNNRPIEKVRRVLGAGKSWLKAKALVLHESELAAPPVLRNGSLAESQPTEAGTFPPSAMSDSRNTAATSPAKTGASGR